MTWEQLLSDPNIIARTMLGLTPQENYLFHHHTQNLNNGGLTNQDGSVSTVRQSVVGEPGDFRNIPTVWGNKELSIDASEDRARQNWSAWPSYATPQAADQRYMNVMHPLMDNDVFQKQMLGATKLRAPIRGL